MPRCLKLLCTLLCAMLFFCACTPFGLQNTGDMLRAPVMGREHGEIKTALVNYLKAEPQYKFPKEGDWRSPLLMADLDGDGVQEGVLFYTLSHSVNPSPEKQENVYMAVLFLRDGEWIVFADVLGPATEVASVEVANMFGDGTSQLVVGYSNANLTAKTLILYQYRDGVLASHNMANTYYSTYYLGDFSGNGREDLAIITWAPATAEESENTASRLEFLTGGDGIFEMPQVPVVLYNNFDSNRSFYIHPSDTAEGKRVLIVDGFSPTGLMMSQIFDMSESDGSFYARDGAADFALATTRSSSLMMARDIDEDGIVEIPVSRTNLYDGSEREERTDNNDKHLRFIEWKDFTTAEGQGKQFGLLDADRNVFVRLPVTWQQDILKDDIVVQDGQAKGEWELLNERTGRVLLSLRGLAAGEIIGETALRVPGDVSAYLVPNARLTLRELEQIQAVLLT